MTCFQAASKLLPSCFQRQNVTPQQAHRTQQAKETTSKPEQQHTQHVTIRNFGRARQSNKNKKPSFSGNTKHNL
jgi:hypothetical protein